MNYLTREDLEHMADYALVCLESGMTIQEIQTDLRAELEITKDPYGKVKQVRVLQFPIDLLEPSLA